MAEIKSSWRSSSNPRKQRKFRANAPLHLKQKLVHAHLSKDLRKKHGKRNFGIRKGDKVRVMAGNYKKHEGKVEKVDLKRSRIYVSGVEATKRDGSKKMLPLEPSNLIIIEMNTDDKNRQKMLERKK